MYIWFATGWAYTGNAEDKGIAGIANSAYFAEVSINDWEKEDGIWSWRNILYIALGLLGL